MKNLTWASLLLILLLCAPMTAEAAPPIPPDMVRRVQLQWEEQPGAQEYEIQFGLTPDLATPLHSRKLKGVTQFTVDLLPGSYYYRVRGIDRTGRPGFWTATQELGINARPPLLIAPKNEEVIQGNLPDTGLPLKWRPSGPGVRYLVEVKAPDEKGEFTRTVARQEFEDSVFPFFPQDIGKFQWSVGTMGPSGVEPGNPWVFSIEGVLPRDAEPMPGFTPRRIVRYVSPWWRNHWTLFARYGQSQLDYTIRDQELGADTHFTGLTGYLSGTLNWEWHDPVSWRIGKVPMPPFGGIPWVEAELQLDRQTVLSESIILPRKAARFGFWYDSWLKRWRFSPIFEYGVRQIAIYQPRSTVEAARATSDRKYFGLGVATEFQMKPFLKLLAQAKFKFESGGEAGFRAVTGSGDRLDLTRRAGDLKGATGLELVAGGAMQLGPKMQVQGRLRYEKTMGSWAPTFFAVRDNGIPEGDTEFTLKNISFDLTFGVKF